MADLALVLAIDCSASVTFDEFNLIAGGTAAALRDPLVGAALLGGREHAALAATLLFSGRDAQDVVVGWTRLATRADIAHLADTVENMPRALRPGLTATGEALAAAAALLASAPEPASRRIIDVAGDGRANDGSDPAAIRDRIVQAGITINALCVLHEEPDFLDYATRTLIGGPGAFAMACADYASFREGMRRKLLREAREVPMV